MDAATGLIYVGNGQYYDPETGRFLTRDAKPNKINSCLQRKIKTKTGVWFSGLFVCKPSAQTIEIYVGQHIAFQHC